MSSSVLCKSKQKLDYTHNAVTNPIWYSVFVKEMIQKQSLSITSVLLVELHSYAYICVCFQAFVSACKKSIEVNTCYSPPTVAAEICTLRLFSCMLSVIGSYVITRAESMLLLL